LPEKGKHQVLKRFERRFENSAEERDFLRGGAEFFQFVMRVFAVLGFGFVNEAARSEAKNQTN
jgi:hypothetical protein